jgi:hypothetical protein
MNEYDQAARFAVKLNPDGFVRWLLSGADPGWRFDGWLETQTIPFPGEPDRRCDTGARLAHADGLAPPWALVLEAQTRPESAFPDRLLEYVARLGRELRHGPHGRDRYLLGAAVVQLTGPAQAIAVDMALSGAGVELRWRVRVRALEEEDAAAVLAEIAAGRAPRCLLPWVPLMRGGGEAGVIDEWKRLAEQETDERRRKEYAGLALVFAELTGNRAAWRQALEKWNMQESQIVKEWKTEAVRRAKQEDILRILALRFKAETPADLAERVREQEDTAALTRWLDAAVTAATLDEFRAAL